MLRCWDALLFLYSNLNLLKCSVRIGFKLSGLITSLGFSYQHEWEMYIYITWGNPSEKSVRDNQYWREIRHKPTWKRWTNCLTYAVMLDLLIEVYIQLLIMLIELKKVLSQEWKCCVGVARLLQANQTAIPEKMDASLFHFYCIWNKYIV